MCNLNIFVKNKEEMEGKEFDSFISAFLCACSNSFVHNNDGDGYYFSDSDEVVKSENKVNLVDYKKKMFQSNFILGHQRLTTHGQGNKYIHPFVNKEFALIHNGIISSFAENGHSDTYMFFNRFMDLYEGSIYGGKSREERIVDTIKTLLDKESGSYSIAIYDKVLGKLFYFKERFMSINFYLRDNKKSLFITTDKTNGEYFNMYKEFNFELQPIQDHTIYEIGFNQNNEIYIISVGEIEDDYGDYYNWRGYTGQEYRGEIQRASNLEEQLDDDNLELIKDEVGVYPVRNSRQCFFCGNKTHNFNPTSQLFVCNNCLFNKQDYMNNFERGYIVRE